MAALEKPGKRTRLSAELSRAQRAAEKLYRHYPNVVGVSAGTKFTKRLATANHAAIHFYVRQKVPAGRADAKSLPRFVYGRFKDGSINRRIRFATDVIEVGRIRSACGAGSAIAGTFGLTRQNGQATLIFENKALVKNHYLISCAHVIGQIDGPNAIPVTVTSDCAPDALPFATTVYSAAQRDGEVEYDVAIAEISLAALPQQDLAIDGTAIHLGSFMSSAAIVPPLPVSCVLPRSGAKRAVISSTAGKVMVEYQKGTYEVGNAWLLKAEKRVKEGDSGGILYDGAVAIGIVFASSGTTEGWAWFHPLVETLAYLKQQAQLDLRCFP